MAGLTREGFTPLTYTEIVNRISDKLRVFSSGIDLSPESPDGQLVQIIAFELSLAWAELGLVYNSYNPNEASGAALRNLGLITGLSYEAATRSQATVELTGVEGTNIPAGAIVTDNDGNEFTTQLATILPATIIVVSSVAGPLNVDAGTITTIKTQITGWTGVSQPNAGKVGLLAQSEVAYRNLRNKTVLRNFTDVAEAIKEKLIEQLGIFQVVVVNNDSPAITAPDGTPPNTIHITVGNAGDVTDEDIAKVILAGKPLGCPTYGSTTVTINDSQGNPKDVKFSRATALPIYINLDVLFLDEDYAGAVDHIRRDLLIHINGLVTGEDVVWSRLFGIITPYAKAQINSLTLSTDGSTYTAANVSVSDVQYPSCVAGQINITVAN